ncbi:hypothetical protein DFJ58DRAFT_880163 [Suillus subalutaceus]|uniref:uncharacterized protein n=1 Tax=Suillus subalutaceus TaxID=48586 RepID=UPI001B8858A5|nr:uncharacterized protein DFJ58DRAFT_880163 [Suillus subalutaceus]KAG1827842.1 hypothetical protein DFJ58DRAFT_880163 [Suillus subalutaceus]
MNLTTSSASSQTAPKKASPSVVTATQARPLSTSSTMKPTLHAKCSSSSEKSAASKNMVLIRKPAAFIRTISDERGQELYAGMRISDVFREDIGLGGVVSLLWFKHHLPSWATKFIEMVLMLTADHGLVVSGATNTIVTPHAGEDLILSLASGLLTIGLGSVGRWMRLLEGE